MTFLSYTDWPNFSVASIDAEKTFLGLGLLVRGVLKERCLKHVRLKHVRRKNVTAPLPVPVPVLEPWPELFIHRPVFTETSERCSRFPEGATINDPHLRGRAVAEWSLALLRDERIK